MADSESGQRNPQPVELLQQLEQASYGEIALDAEADAVETWRGFAFAIEDLHFCLPFSSGYEIVPETGVQPLPMSRDWVRGMTNVRGEVYTVVDFARFIDRAPATLNRGASLLLLPDRGLRSALLLENRINLKTFAQDLPRVENHRLGATVSPYLSAVVLEDETQWGVLDVAALSGADDFVNIGL